MPFYAVGQTGVPFGIIDVVQIPVNAAELNGLSGSYYRNATNLTGTAQLSGSFTGSFSGNLTGTASNADFLDNLDSTYFRNGANLTGTINATQFGGQSSGYYRNAANLSGTAQLTGSFTGIFSGNLTGTASNADFLDSLDSSYFRNGANLTGTINASQLSGQNPAYFRDASNITGVLAVANGGLGTGTLTANSVVLGNNTSAVQTVSPSTSGNVLTSDGTTWKSLAAAGGGSLIYISTQIAAGNPSTIQFTSGIDSTYDDYLIIFENIEFSLTNRGLTIRLRKNGSFETSGYFFSYFTLSSGTTAVTQVSQSTIQTTLNNTSGTSYYVSGMLYLLNVNNAQAYKQHVIGQYTQAASTQSDSRSGTFSGSSATAASVTGIEFGGNGATFSSGTFRLYGIKKS